MKQNVLIVHGGAPTAVMNASLYGVISEAVRCGEIHQIFGARGGSRGFIEEDFIDLKKLDSEQLKRLPFTPASYIGTSRFPVGEDGYARMVDVLLRHNIDIVLFNGGNGSMDTCGKLSRAIDRLAPKRNIRVAGIPKTIDNDIAVTDHAPGFGSAARYLAASIQEIARDIASLPIHVSIVESMGRNAGWLTAAAALAKADTDSHLSFGSDCNNPLGPHLIYLPEIPFDEEEFLDTAGTLYRRFGGVLVVASEGLRGKDGKPIVAPIFQTGRSVYYGDVSAHLSNLVIKRLNIKARSEKPGILGRCSIAHQSPVDREEAIIAGSEALLGALAGHSRFMVAFKRISDQPYRCETYRVPIEQVMLHERTVPDEYIDRTHHGVTDVFVNWCRPLLGPPLSSFTPYRIGG